MFYTTWKKEHWTPLLKAQFDEQKFENSFTTWEFQLSKYEQDNNTLLPDAVKIAVLLHETKGPLQQYLQLQAGNITTYAQIRSMVIEIHGDRILQSNSNIHQATSNHIRQQQPRTGTDGHRSNIRRANTRAKELNKGKGYGSYGNNYNYKGGKGKYNQQLVGQGNPFQGQQGYGKGKGYNNQRKVKGYYNNQQGGKEAKGKHATNVCYRCGQPKHMAKQCRVAIHNCDTGNFDANDQTADIPTTPTGTCKRTTAQNSDQPAHQALRVQMGLRDRPQWTTNCHTISCLRGYTANPFGYKAGGTRCPTYIG